MRLFCGNRGQNGGTTYGTASAAGSPTGRGLLLALGLLVVGVQPAAARQHCWSTTTTLSVLRRSTQRSGRQSPRRATATRFKSVPERIPSCRDRSTSTRASRCWAPQAGQRCANPRRARSRSITDPQGTIVSASNVVIDGFTVQDSTVAAFTGYGIWLQPGRQRHADPQQHHPEQHRRHRPRQQRTSQALIRHNLIQNNNLPGGSSGTGHLHRSSSSAGSVVRNVLIEENTFTGHDDARHRRAATPISSSGVFNLDVDVELVQLERPGHRALQHA